ncbi:selenium-dependent molybdenum cofactor biosynthesis protein YqeB [Pelosinus sp. sgz500959]|uniref:selenium-dependent molybdenum cofactor biosynthesis protein YqeB n=1 Tax=Pelosinus sp. sgz500959 TaxID=3242472 RepID=UPI00366FB0C9
MQDLVIIKGAGDLATGIAYRLFRSGFKVIMTELALPTVIRRTAAFAEAVFSGQMVVEGLVAVKTELDDVLQIIDKGQIPVVVDPQGLVIHMYKPLAVVDAMLAKKNIGTKRTDAPIVIGVGPGFTAGQDVHAIVESMRGHYLGRVITEGQALTDTGIPGEIGGYTKERILRAPCQGIFTAVAKIGDKVLVGDTVAYVDDQPVIASVAGILRGLLHDDLVVPKDMKIGDIDPRCIFEHCFSISDKARAIGGGVLEAILFHRTQGMSQK